MMFRMSQNIAIGADQFLEAVDFYTRVVGFENRLIDSELAEFDASPLNLFIIADDEVRGPVMELFVGDLEEALDFLVANGCKVLRWSGKGQDCYIEDPFGVIFSLWEE